MGYSPFSVTEEPTLSEAIKAYRLRHGLSQRKMAMDLGIDPTTLARCEEGEATPSTNLGQRLAELLDYPDLGKNMG